MSLGALDQSVAWPVMTGVTADNMVVNVRAVKGGGGRAGGRTNVNVNQRTNVNVNPSAQMSTSMPAGTSMWCGGQSGYGCRGHITERLLAASPWGR